MSEFLKSLNFSQHTAARLWLKLDRDTRREAARCLYTLEEDERHESSLSADVAIAKDMRFRIPTVRKLPIEKKVGYLATVVRPDESLATMLLQAMHFKLRRPMLGAFLDALGVEHDDGHIKEEVDMSQKTAAEITAAADKLYAAYPPAEVDVYLASLLAFESEAWAGLADHLAKRSGA